MPYNNYKGEYMADFEVVFYEKEDGDCPVEEFINSLDVKMRAKMVGLLEIKLAKERRADFKERMGKL
jgi:hypothetical protein